MRPLLLLPLLLLLAHRALAQPAMVQQVAAAYAAAYQAGHWRELDFDFRVDLARPDSGGRAESAALKQLRRQLRRAGRGPLTAADQQLYDQLTHELNQRLAYRQLREEAAPRRVPGTAEGLASLPQHHRWYAFYARRSAGVAWSADQLFAFGEQQVRRAQEEIRRLRRQMGYGADSAGFYRQLDAAPDAWLTDTLAVAAGYRAVAARVRAGLPWLFADTLVPALPIRPWAGATPAMPPAIYLEDHQPPTFAYNFSTGRLARRALAWSYLHEAVPGHHYQLSLSRPGPPAPLAALGLYYPATVEGWGCYVEYLGGELGAYATPLDELGHWQWDLVRSARVVLDVGLHDRGWTRARALAWWQAHVPGQHDIAAREIDRVIRWPGQCLSYKVGAARLEALRARLARRPDFEVRRFHAAVLALSHLPLEVLEQHLAASL